MNFTYLEKKAMVRLLVTIALGDGQADINEVSVIQDELDIDANLLRASAEIEIADAISTLRAMDIHKRLEFSSIAMKVAKADGNLHHNEKVLLMGYNDAIGVNEFLDAHNDFQNKLRKHNIIK